MSAPASAYSAVALARLLDEPEPTPEQRRIIESDLRAGLVVAGAGSGKTTTMANRVVWLVANGYARPEEVLGLTFTRKAARELRDRIADFLGRLPAEVLVGARAADDAEGGDAPLLPLRPVVSTYNSFASELYRSHALVIGEDPEADVLSESAAWLLARRTVIESRQPGLAELDKRVGDVVDAVLGLAHALADNAVPDTQQVLAYAARLARTRVETSDPALGKQAAYAAEMAMIDRVQSLELLVPIVEDYRAAKRRRGVMEFSDQVAFALAIAEASPATVDAIRARHRFVILDEYQDTSVVQTRLLATLFRERAGEGPRSITAVGDPNQAIYGWRGASEANLASFRTDFGVDPEEVREFQLMTSWRNPQRVLDGANAVAAPLRLASDVHVERLEPRPRADLGRVDAIWGETIDDEAERVAAWLRSRLAEPTAAGAPTAAVLFRKRAHMARFATILDRAGIRCRVLGAGGLFSTPEATDLLAGLRVLIDPDGGSALIRLLAGARWRIGLADLVALEDVSGQIHHQRTGGAKGHRDGRSVVDGLDALVDASDAWDALEAFTPDGLERLRAAGRTFRELRSRVGIPLLDLVRVVEEALLLDIEVVANDQRSDGAANLRALRQHVEAFVRTSEQATLGAFLAWTDRVLDAGERVDGPAEDPAEPGVVQLLTVHAAKGLQWDVVAIPRLVAGEFPAASREGAGWVDFGELPYEFRGDADVLRRQAWFPWERATTRAELRAALLGFKRDLRARFEREERRLGYVAVTRTKRDLLLSGSFWPGVYNPSTRGYEPRPVAPYIDDFVEAGVLPAGSPGLSRYEADPADERAFDLPWPLDPLGDRRASVERAAALVHAELAAEVPTEPTGRWARDLRLLLDERFRVRATLRLPGRLAASKFKDWVADPVLEARAFVRPMPEQPFRATRLGTLFHAWVEERYRNIAPESLFDLDDPLGDDERGGLAPADAARLEVLKATFERSEWAFLEPIAVEVAIDLPFAGRSIPARIDAVFERDGRIEIIDWKTGRAPATAEQRTAFDYQLAFYRIAWASATSTPIDQIDAKAYFVATDEVYAPPALPDETQLMARWNAAMAVLESQDATRPPGEPGRGDPRPR